jgi:rRNA maturation endonuclease Nob1
MIIAVACLIAIIILAFVLGVRAKDLPAPEPESPYKHLDDRKAAIYENLRDLQFEYRLGKLSDADYQTTKKDLQKELAVVLAEVDRLKAELGVAPASRAAQPASVSARPVTPKGQFVCGACGAAFPQDLKFCGECGKPMKVAK